jgi:hypothetical protein
MSTKARSSATDSGVESPFLDEEIFTAEPEENRQAQTAFAPASPFERALERPLDEADEEEHFEGNLPEITGLRELDDPGHSSQSEQEALWDVDPVAGESSLLPLEQQVRRGRSAATPPKPVCSAVSATTGRWLSPLTLSDSTIPKYKDAAGTLRASDCALYVPDAALNDETLDLLVFFHGDPGPCLDCFDPDPEQTPKKFGLDAQIQNSKRKIALAVPRLHWSGSNVSQIKGKWSAANFNKFVQEALDEIGRQTSKKRKLGSLIIAGHSRAHAILTPLAREFNEGASATMTDHLARLAEVWALDSTYGQMHVRALEAWASARPTVRFVAVLYKNGSPSGNWKNYYKAHSFGFGPPPNLRVCAVDDGGWKTHCVIPTKYVGNLLLTTRSSPNWCSP